MPSLPSIASDFAATVSLTLPPRMQASTANPDLDAQPFAALLDASTLAPTSPAPPTVPPAPANPPQATQTAPPASTVSTAAPAPTDPPQATQTAPSVNTAPTAAPALTDPPQTGEPAAAGSASNGIIGNFHFRLIPQANATSAANASATGQAGAARNAAAGSNQANAASTATSVPNVGMALSADATAGAQPGDSRTSAAQPAAVSSASSNVQSTATQAPASPVWTGKHPAIEADNDQADTDPAAASGAATSASQVANPLPQIAAVTIPNASATDPAPAGPTMSAAGMAIGEQTRARAILSRTAGQDSQASQTGQQTAPAPDGKTAPDVSAPKPALSPETAGTPTTANASSAQQTPADGGAPPGDASPPVDAAAMRATAFAAAGQAAGSGSSNGQPATAAVQSATANLPTFGIAAPAATAGQGAAAAQPTPASAAAVAVSGLPIAIAVRSQAGLNQFEIRLDPPELGRIDVRLGVDANGQVTSHVTVDRPETLSLLQSQQPQLERALEQAGLKTADNGLQFTLRDQSFTGSNSGNGGGATPSPAQQLVVPDADLRSIDATQIYSRWNLGAGIDISV